ncbi:GTPase subunit of restriction endonuclease [Thermoanaerobacter thermohydrosulfuricus WC1]|uniref:GTPase subunit of restriction endonuclease n=2 Tax=Thermoanaerobacter thermohydrosulfuricus TaxID=1516 RepID=M8DFR5_THETY|nr:GTPase subunit of restriction endonuclease [Thermoanaerobacter thermohydrosulfuricus WC1]
MSLKTLFKEVMDNYIKARTSQPFKGNRIGDILRKEIPQEIQKFDFIGDEYFIKGSNGQGNWAEIPWVAIMDKNITQTTMEGVYIVYLFSSDMKRLYLTLNQGYTKLKDKYSKLVAIKKMLSLALKIRSKMEAKGWNTDNNLSIGNEFYEKGTIFYKKYENDDLPDDETLKNDLHDLINIYKNVSVLSGEDKEQIYENEEDYIPDNDTSYNVKDELDYIKSYIKNQGFSYNDKLIENFYLSLKSKPFLILAGISGTGKSKLARLFAEAIGCNTKNGRFMLVPVRPDWSDSTELLGYKDMHNKFHPGVLTNFIKRAINDINRPYFFVLDEMNLARVEHYFSDILSIIESRKKDGDRIVTDHLLNKELLDEDSFHEYGNLYIPENLYFIGTVNMDETTFPFSKKVLDRANVIEFSDVNLDYFVGDIEEITEKVLNNSFLKSEFLTLNDCLDYREIIDDVILVLKKINDVLREGNLHFGYRVRDEISFYMIYNELNGLMDFDEAMDLEILQKILPRIHGSSISMKKILVELFKICSGNYEAKYEYEDMDVSDKMLKDMDNCVYPRSAEKIIYMVRRYEEDGFTSYWL